MKKGMTFFGVQVGAPTLAEARDALKKKQLIFTPNPEILLEASRNASYREALSKGTLMLPDGHGLQVVSTLMRFPRLLRLALFPFALLVYLVLKAPFRSVFSELIHGSDFMMEVAAKAAHEGLSVFFLGGRPGVAEKTARVFQARYPRLKVAGASATDPGEAAFKEVLDSKAQVLFVAYGAPKQELWLADYFSRLPILRLAMGVGGSFDFYSGTVRRAPRLLRSLGLEWLWRLLLNPVQRGKRIWNAVFVFPFKALF